MAKDSILTVAGIQAILHVGWRNAKDIVRTYIRASAAHITEGDLAGPTRSWCGDFAFWVLRESGITPLPPLAAPVSGGWNTVSRYGQTYQTFKPRAGTPSPGDMYYMRYTTEAAKEVGGNGTNHVGFVVEYDPDKPSFMSVDGNSGTDPSILVKGIGGGYVCYNQRNLSLVDFFIRIPG